jgi:hypothetical protein
MTITYGPEDALYGVARFGVASYGSVGPTKQITGVTSLFTLGTLTSNGKAVASLVGYNLNLPLGQLTFSADAFKALLGYSPLFSLGEPTVRSINRVEVLGVSAAFNLGLLTVEGGTGFTLIPESFQLNTTLGTVKSNLTTFASGNSITISVNSFINLLTDATTNITGVAAEFSIEEVTTSGAVLNYNVFAEQYSPKRTAYIPKVA